MLRYTAVLIVASLSLVASEARSAPSFDHDAFCGSVKEFAAKFNKDVGQMVDRTTRNDGMAVLCNTKVIDYKKFITMPVRAMRDGWKERKARQWNNIYCEAGSVWQQAIEAGWTVATTITFIDGKRVWLTADCN